jgi:hypothetical protein
MSSNYEKILLYNIPPSFYVQNKDNKFSSLKVYFSAHHIDNIKKNHSTIFLIHWISDIIIKTTFNNTLKDDVTIHI